MNHQDGSPKEQLSARELTDRIKSVVAELWQLIIVAHETAAWLDLGYGSWQEYCQAEFDTDHMRITAGDERNRVVRMMTYAGMSTREISAATGLSQKSVSRSTNESVDSGDDHEPSVPSILSPPAPKPDRRRPLPESFRQATFDLDRVTARIERLAEDDRFNRNVDRIVVNRRELARMRDALDRVIGKMEAITAVSGC